MKEEKEEAEKNKGNVQTKAREVKAEGFMLR